MRTIKINFRLIALGLLSRSEIQSNGNYIFSSLGYCYRFQRKTCVNKNNNKIIHSTEYFVELPCPQAGKHLEKY